MEIQNQKGQEEEIYESVGKMSESEIIKTITDIMDKVVEDAKMQKIVSFELRYSRYLEMQPLSKSKIHIGEELYFEIEESLNKEIAIKIINKRDKIDIYKNDLHIRQFIKVDGLNINFKKIFKELKEKYYHKLREIALMNAIKEYNQKFNKNISINDIELDKSKLLILKPFLAEIGTYYFMARLGYYEKGFYLFFKNIDFE